MAENVRQATVAIVLDGIRKEALLGDFEGERQIGETEVATEYQVSRSSVRTAFQILERDGLIEIQPNGRKLLKKIDAKYIEDLCITRSILECEAVRLIIKKDDCDFSELLQCVARFYLEDKKPQSKERTNNLSLINDQFHNTLFLMAENRALLQCWCTLAPMILTIVRLNTTIDLELNEHGYYESHKKITEMLMERDTAVVDYIRYHATNATKNDIMLAIKKLSSERKS